MFLPDTDPNITSCPFDFISVGSITVIPKIGISKFLFIICLESESLVSSILPCLCISSKNRSKSILLFKNWKACSETRLLKNCYVFIKYYF